MTTRYLAFSKSTGECLGSKDRFEPPADTDEVRYLESMASVASYLDEDVVMPKLAFPVTPGMRMTGIPAGTTADIEGQSYVIDDGVLELDTNAIAPIAVRLRHPRYLTMAFEVMP